MKDKIKKFFKYIKELCIPAYMICPYVDNKDICDNCECEKCDLNPYYKNK